MTNQTPVQTVPVRIKLFSPEVSLPRYQSSEAAGFDLSVSGTYTIPPQTTMIVPTGIAIDIPAGFWILVTARSSLHKRGLILANGIGVVDSDYRGDNDEYHLVLHNITGEQVTIEKGARLAQCILMPRLEASFTQVEALGHPDRGGFGSTDVSNPH